MPRIESQQTSKNIEWNKVTWYSKLLAVILFVGLVCGVFYFGIWYQRQTSPAVTTPLPTPTSALKDSEISYPVGFSQELSNTSTEGWRTYKNKNGWEVQYPADWSIAECFDGAQIQFAYSSDYVTCDAPTSANFTIVGPMQEEEAMYNANKARIEQTFDLNGIQASRYMDALCGQSGSDFCEIVSVIHNGQYYNLNFSPFAFYNLTAEKIMSTFKFVQ